MNAVSQTLAMLLRQQESHYGELLDLEEKLRKHRLGYLQLSAEISALIKLESDAGAGKAHADSSPPASHSLGAGGGFILRAVTPRGRESLPKLERLLARLPHTGDL